MVTVVFPDFQLESAEMQHLSQVWLLELEVQVGEIIWSFESFISEYVTECMSLAKNIGQECRLVQVLKSRNG